MQPPQTSENSSCRPHETGPKMRLGLLELEIRLVGDAHDPGHVDLPFHIVDAGNLSGLRGHALRSLCALGLGHDFTFLRPLPHLYVR